MRLLNAALGAAMTFALGACGSAPPEVTPTAGVGGTPLELEVTVVQEGLSVPWDIGFSSDGVMFVTERSGTVRIYASGEPGAELLASYRVSAMRQAGESGLMGLAVDPDFVDNRYVYVCASRDEDGEDGSAPWVNDVLRLHVSDDWTVELDGRLLDPAPRANRQHNGCALEIDSSGMLWITMGDSLAGKDGWPQQPRRLNGKVLRINLDGSTPEDNPIFDGVGEPTPVYSMGHRNPQGIAFHPASGLPYASEHGTTINDEVNLIEAGANYGWPCVSGASDEGLPDIDPAHCRRSADFRPPVWASGAPTIATSGAAFLTGELWGEWEGSLIVACLKEQDLRRFVASEEGQTLTMVETLLDGQYGRLRAAVLAPDGSLYVSTSNQPNAGGANAPPQPNLERDVILRIRPTQ